MIAITAVIRAKPGKEALVRRALLKVAAAVAAGEPDTVGYFVAEASEAPGLFTTYERFRDRQAMQRHNDSPAVAAFVAATKDALAAPVELHTAEEISAK